MSDNIYQSFNARSLRPEKIGRGFVFYPAMQLAAESSNSVIIGPRGSGKTTLLRMLSLPVILSTRQDLRDKFTSNIDYISIFVASDFTWYPEFRLTAGRNNVKEFDDRLTYALFRFHVLKSVCSSLSHAGDPRLRDDKDLSQFYHDENTKRFELFVSVLAESWGVKPKFGGLFGLKQALNKQIRHVQSLLSRLISDIEGLSVSASDIKEIDGNVFDDLSDFADAYEEFVHSGRTWALCFDETEIAPRVIKQQIWSSLRSFDPRFLIKISGAPYDEYLDFYTSEKSPKPDQDFAIVNLFERGKSDVADFSKGILRGIASEHGINLNNPSECFGLSYYDDDFNINDESHSADEKLNKRDRNRLQADGFYERKFKSLLDLDSSFGEYLNRNSIRIGELDTPDANRRALIRKLLSIVVVREAHLFATKPQTRKVSRRLKGKKAIDRLYTGAESLFTACEGNPRWLIWVLRPLLQALADTGSNSGRISRAKQAQRLQHSITSLLALLSTIRPVHDAEGNSIVELVESIGTKFREGVLGKAFPAEPVLSFIIDKDVEEKMIPVIGQALNQGAMVLIPHKNRPRTYGSIFGERVRLSHLLAPKYHLPMISGRPVNLSNLLDTKSDNIPNTQMILENLFKAGAK